MSCTEKGKETNLIPLVKCKMIPLKYDVLKAHLLKSSKIRRPTKKKKEKEKKKEPTPGLLFLWHSLTSTLRILAFLLCQILLTYSKRTGNL